MSAMYRYFKEVTSEIDLLPVKTTSLPDLMGRTLQVGTFVCAPFSFGTAGNVSSAEAEAITDGSLDGIEMLAFLELSKRLNFTWKLHEPSGNWGHFNNGTWSGGLIGGLASGALDVAFCTLWITEEQMTVMDYVVPWNQICNTFLVPRSGVTLTWRSVFLTLDGKVWAVLGLSVLATSLALFILTHLHRVTLQPLVKPHKYERLDTSFVEVVGMLALAYSPSPERILGPSRYVICWWFVFAMLVTTAYSCGLASRLTLPQNNPPLDSVKDLVEAGFHWGHTYCPTVDIIFDKNNPWHEKFIERFVILDDTDHSYLLKRGKHAVFGYKLDVGTNYFLETERVEADDWESMRVMKECMSRFFISLGLAKDSPYTAAFNEGLIRLEEAGIMDKWQRDVLLRRGNRNISFMLQEKRSVIDSAGPLKLSMANLQGAFIILILGNTVATFIFISEGAMNKLY
ncbi:glutamate receptor ionotropic, delta-1 [Cryptotermes secundus]|uniref:glutamate receptor ionotropic, delta-1 n=1 Tax=Cryptotermes secundus TaxID=105785 RepID=UPI001454D949|nr:glutamate receptor ionotropic, delta-1 [Cryptotermes secundus]